jgi:hypothetical protein
MSDCDRKDGAEASAHRIPMLKIWESELQSLGHRLEGAESRELISNDRRMRMLILR